MERELYDIFWTTAGFGGGNERRARDFIEDAILCGDLTAGFWDLKGSSPASTVNGVREAWMVCPDDECCGLRLAMIDTLEDIETLTALMCPSSVAFSPICAKDAWMQRRGSPQAVHVRMHFLLSLLAHDGLMDVVRRKSSGYFRVGMSHLELPLLIEIDEAAAVRGQANWVATVHPNSRECVLLSDEGRRVSYWPREPTMAVLLCKYLKKTY